MMSACLIGMPSFMARIMWGNLTRGRHSSSPPITLESISSLSRSAHLLTALDVISRALRMSPFKLAIRLAINSRALGSMIRVPTRACRIARMSASL